MVAQYPAGSWACGIAVHPPSATGTGAAVGGGTGAGADVGDGSNPQFPSQRGGFRSQGHHWYPSSHLAQYASVVAHRPSASSLWGMGVQPEAAVAAKRNESTSVTERSLIDRYIAAVCLFVGFDSASKRDCERNENHKSKFEK